MPSQPRLTRSRASQAFTLTFAPLNRVIAAKMATGEKSPESDGLDPPLAAEDVANEDKRAIRALIADAECGNSTEGAMTDIIPLASN
jgi:hypothetical protein